MIRKYAKINVFLILVGAICSLLSKNYGWVLLDDVGVSLITGAVTAFATAWLLSEQYENSVQEKWGLKQIYSVRSDMNHNCDVCLEKCSKHLDFIALGLKNFRDMSTDMVIQKINSGVKIRIITVHPDSKFLEQKAIEEGSHVDSMSSSIQDMIQWAKDINARTQEGAIQVKTYDGLPMFSYQRIDDSIFVGPNLYGMSSQKCITYEYYRGEGKEYFVNYFEKLWNHKNMTSVV